MPTDWVLLSYRLPREPSTPRIAMWRKLKRLGALQIIDGLVALPDEPRTREAFEWLAAEVKTNGGTAITWLARPSIAQFGRDLAADLAMARATEYQAIIDEAAEAAHMSESGRRAAHKRLRAELHRIGKRDYFPPAERAQAHAAIAKIGPS